MAATRCTLRQLQEAVERTPNDAHANYCLGLAHRTREEWDAALVFLERAWNQGPDPHHALVLAQAYAARKRRPAAIDVLRACLQRAPHVIHAALALGHHCEKLSDTAGALAAYGHAIKHAPDEVLGYERLHALLLEGRTPAECGALAREQLVGDVDDAPMMAGLAQALESHGRYVEAATCWAQIRSITPDHPRARLGAGHNHAVRGDVKSAEALFLAGLAQAPTSIALILSYARLMLRTGQLDVLRGLLRDPLRRQVIASALVYGEPALAPPWDDAHDLHGKTVFLNCVGGYGDVLQYGRFAALLRARGARVIAQVPRRIAALASALDGIDDVVLPFDACAPYDYECAPAYASFLLDWHPDWITRTIPYLSVEPELRPLWRQRFDPGHLNVGIVWHSRHPARKDAYQFRSAPLAPFAALADVPGIRLYSLQVGAGTQDLMSAHWVHANLEHESAEFTAAAAAIDALDAVVSVDTGIAHLAGALGCPGFFVLPYHPCDRWMTAAPAFRNGECVWYPSAKLYVQERPGDWASALAAVAADLRVLATRGQKPRAARANARGRA